MQNLSGRVLRRLPLQALAMYANDDPCTMEMALVALERAVMAQGLADT